MGKGLLPRSESGPRETDEEAYDRTCLEAEERAKEELERSRRQLEMELYGHELSDSERAALDEAARQEFLRMSAEVDRRKEEWLAEWRRTEEEARVVSQQRAREQELKMRAIHRRAMRVNAWLAGVGPYPRDEEE